MRLSPTPTPACPARPTNDENTRYSIARYPVDLIDVLLLPDGRRATLRPVLPQDATLLDAFVRGLRPQSRYLRFQGAVNELAPSMLRSMTEVDYGSHLGLVAESFDGIGQLPVAEARYVAEPGNRDAQFAIAVADGWLRLGIGRRLLQTLASHARRRGFDRLVGDVLPENEPMLALAAALGAVARRSPLDPGLRRVEIDLRGDRRAISPA